MSTLIVLLLLIFATNLVAHHIARLGCPTECGSVKIMHPFGIGEKCYLDKRYEIECKNTSNLQQPFLVEIDTLVHEITVRDISVQHWNVSTCDNGSKRYNFTGGPFALPNQDNKLTAIGCDIYAYITDLSSINPTSGCISLCDGGNSYSANGSCSGNGCCHSEIPYKYSHQMKNFEVGTVSLNTKNTSGTSAGGYCSTIMIGEDRRYYMGKDYLAINQNFSRRMTLTWSINGTCRNSICDNNDYTYCTSSNQEYNCYCSEGYNLSFGSPYVPNGCKRGKKLCSGRNSSTLYCLRGEECAHHQGNWFCIRKDVLSVTAIIAIAVGGSLFLMIILAIVYWFYEKLKKRRIILLKRKFFKQNGGLLLQQQISSGESNVEKSKIFLQGELEKATDNFNESRVLGRGGSGTVYKGMLPDGRIVAIKKSKIVDEGQIGQFINELVILSQINHRHIVKVMGCCLETEVPLLVYEFVSNGTLSEHLHKEDLKASISWEDRLRICKEIAGALLYLHSAASTPIYHRDIKSSNILLDETYKAKVSDFGISRSITNEQTHLTTLVQGTFGYLDPEYFHSGQFTDKSDVYSFGVVLVELLTGQKPVSLTRSEDEANLAMSFISSVKEDRVLQLLEARVRKEARIEEIHIVASLAKKCLKLIGKKRPTMKEVCLQLENLRGVLPQDYVTLL